jgi:deoxyhypusine synthase
MSGAPGPTGARIRPAPITARTSLTELVDGALLAYNGARLREACQLFTRKMLEPDTVVGLSLTGALTPAGLGVSALIPLLRAGFVDWIVSTGANLYHDAHFALDLELRAARPGLDDRVLREQQLVRIYDILFDYDVLLQTDAFFRQVIAAEEFQHAMSTAEFHYRVGRYVRERERALGCEGASLLGVAWETGVPVYTSSPGDSSIGMNVARHALEGGGLRLDVTLDVNETAAIVLDAKHSGRSAVCILGGGSPKNFILQTEPQIQEVLGIDEKGHDYFLQVTDARPDTGGLSGATPSEAVTWGKVDPDQLPDAVTCYTDSTIALPLLTAYALQNHEPRPLRRLYDRRADLLTSLESAFHEAQGDA